MISSAGTRRRGSNINGDGTQVVLSGAAIFCPAVDSMCLDAQKMVTVALLVAGGVVYTFAPPAIQLEELEAKKEKKKQ